MQPSSWRRIQSIPSLHSSPPTNHSIYCSLEEQIFLFFCLFLVFLLNPICASHQINKKIYFLFKKNYDVFFVTSIFPHFFPLACLYVDNPPSLPSSSPPLPSPPLPPCTWFSLTTGETTPTLPDQTESIGDLQSNWTLSGEGGGGILRMVAPPPSLFSSSFSRKTKINGRPLVSHVQRPVSISIFSVVFSCLMYLSLSASLYETLKSLFFSFLPLPPLWER